MPRGQGLLKFFRNTGLVSNGRCHVCTRGQNSQYQLEKQALLTFCRRFPCADACLTSSSPKHLICCFFFKKGELQFRVSNSLPCSLHINHSQDDAEALSGTYIHCHCYFLNIAASSQIYKARMMLSLIPLTMSADSSYQGK